MSGQTMLMCGIIWGVIGAVATYNIYERKDRDPMTGAIIGGILGAIGGIILLAPLWLLVPNAGKNCPRCAEKVKQAAQVCKHCGYEFYNQPYMKNKNF